MARVRAITDRFRAQWNQTAAPDREMPLVGTSGRMVVADTDAQARKYRDARWYASFMHLWRKFDNVPQFVTFPEDFDQACAMGMAVVGMPAFS